MHSARHQLYIGSDVGDMICNGRILSNHLAQLHQTGASPACMKNSMKSILLALYFHNPSLHHKGFLPHLLQRDAEKDLQLAVGP